MDGEALEFTNASHPNALIEFRECGLRKYDGGYRSASSVIFPKSIKEILIPKNESMGVDLVFHLILVNRYAWLLPPDDNQIGFLPGLALLLQER